MKREALEAAKNAYKIESECIATMLEYFDEEQFSKAVELLKNAERIGTSGCGHSGIICQHMAHLMCCIERPTRFISPAEAVHGATGLLPILDICKVKGVKVITITEDLNSVLATSADVVLKQYVNRETDKYNSQGTTSTTALCMIFHALQAALLFLPL